MQCYEITDNFNVSSYSALEYCLNGAVKLTKNADFDKYGYSSYALGFDRHGFLSHPSGRTGRKVIIFGADMNSSTKIDNRKKDILILGKDPAQRLFNFTKKPKNFVWPCIIIKKIVTCLLIVQIDSYS